ATPVLCILSLRDALPICGLGGAPGGIGGAPAGLGGAPGGFGGAPSGFGGAPAAFAGASSGSRSSGISPKTMVILGVVGFVVLARSEEHTSELQSRENLVC